MTSATIWKTAKSYENWRKVSEPIEMGGKHYINVEKNGVRKMVRLYTEKEYERMYQSKQGAKSEREALGFNSLGYVYIFKKDTQPYNNELKESNAAYNHLWGWYFNPHEEIPANLYCLEPIKLYWAEVGDTAGALYPSSRIKEAVYKLKYDMGDSQVVGKVGDRLELYVTLIDTIFLRGGYVNYYFKDNENNLYSWVTKKITKIQKEKIIHLKGTVKDKELTTRREKTEWVNILTRCRIYE